MERDREGKGTEGKGKEREREKGEGIETGGCCVMALMGDRLPCCCTRKRVICHNQQIDAERNK